MTFRYGIDQLTVDKVMAILKGELKGIIIPEIASLVNECRRKVESMAASDKAVYGINTGFGSLCDVQISPAETNTLQKNLFS